MTRHLPLSTGAGAPSVLECEGIFVDFSGFQVLRGVSLRVEARRTLALIGPNGAGKTTLMNTFSGLLRPAAGRVLLAGEDVTQLSASELAMRGLARSFQTVNVFPGLTVWENLRVAVQRHHFRRAPFWRPVRHYAELADATESAVERVKLGAVKHRIAGELSHGLQRALELGMTLVGDPKLLLLDEPLAGVGHSELPGFVQLLQTICRTNTVMLIDHNMDAVMKLADAIVVMVGGEVLTQGTPEQIRVDPQVRASYLGSEALA